jgi:hypothetical protein
MSPPRKAKETSAVAGLPALLLYIPTVQRRNFDRDKLHSARTFHTFLDFEQDDFGR